MRIPEKGRAEPWPLNISQVWSRGLLGADVQRFRLSGDTNSGGEQRPRNIFRKIWFEFIWLLTFWCKSNWGKEISTCRRSRPRRSALTGITSCTCGRQASAASGEGRSWTAGIGPRLKGQVNPDELAVTSDFKRCHEAQTEMPVVNLWSLSHWFATSVKLGPRRPFAWPLWLFDGWLYLGLRLMMNSGDISLHQFQFEWYSSDCTDKLATLKYSFQGGTRPSTSFEIISNHTFMFICH